MRKHRDWMTEQRDAATCPHCDKSIDEMYVTADAIASDRRRKAIRNAPKDLRKKASSEPRDGGSNPPGCTF